MRIVLSDKARADLLRIFHISMSVVPLPPMISFAGSMRISRISLDFPSSGGNALSLLSDCGVSLSEFISFFTPEHIAVKWNRDVLWNHLLSHVFSENRFPLFRTCSNDGDDIAIVRVIDGRMDVDEEFQR
jgi:hypothetical protein